MLRAVQGNQIDLRCLKKYVNCRFQPAVDAAWIGHKTDTLAAKLLETGLAKNLDAGFDNACRLGFNLFPAR